MLQSTAIFMVRAVLFNLFSPHFASSKQQGGAWALSRSSNEAPVCNDVLLQALCFKVSDRSRSRKMPSRRAENHPPGQNKF